MGIVIFSYVSLSDYMLAALLHLTQITRDDEIVAVIVHETLYPVNVRDILYRHSVQHKVADPVVHNRMKHFRAVLR